MHMTLSQKFLHVLTHDRSIRVAAILSGAASFILCGLFFYVGTTYSEYLSNKISNGVSRGIETELARLTSAREKITSQQNYIDAVTRGDSAEVTRILKEGQVVESIGPLSMVTKEGFVLSRTRDPHSRGDNIFLTSAIGRALVSGQTEVTSVEQGTVNGKEILFISGGLIPNTSPNAGALFATYLADDAFAQRFATTYLGTNTRVAFYTHEYGIYGANIRDERNRKILDSNIQANSDWLEHTHEPVIFRLVDGQIFLAKNIVIKSVESSHVGVVVFEPLWPLFILALLVVIIPFIVFIVACRILHRRALKQENRRRYYTAAYALGFTGMLAVILIFFFVLRSLPTLEDFRYPLYNSTLRLQPDNGYFDSNQEQKVSIILDSGGEAINAISFSLLFDPSYMSVQSLDTEGSICTLFIRKEINPSGTVDVDCVIPNPGYQNTGGRVANIYIKGKKDGNASLTFSNETEVLANDGLGTNVLRFSSGAHFTFDDPLDGNNSSSTFAVFSSTHPNSERWYPQKNINLFWIPRVPVSIEVKGAKGYVQKVVYNKPPAVIQVPSDGIYVVSVREIDSKLIPLTLSLQIDSTAPEQVALEASDTVVNIGDLVRFTARASDSLSGLQRTAYLKIDNRLFFPIGNEIYIPFYSTGVHTITLRAYDKAGNYTDDSVDVVVK